jgi:hypothetical protein
VLSWLVKDRSELALIMEVPTHEKIAVAYAKHNQALCDAVENAIDAEKKRHIRRAAKKMVPAHTASLAGRCSRMS